MVENGIIVKVKARTERSPERGERRGGQKKSRPHGSLPAYDGAPSRTAAAPPPAGRVPRPKTSAERQARVAEILRRLDHMYPGATCALHHSNPWELRVATILSAQCTDKRVNEVTPGLFAKYPTPQDFAAVRRSEEHTSELQSRGH